MTDDELYGPIECDGGCGKLVHEGACDNPAPTPRPDGVSEHSLTCECPECYGYGSVADLLNAWARGRNVAEADQCDGRSLHLLVRRLQTVEVPHLPATPPARISADGVSEPTIHMERDEAVRVTQKLVKNLVSPAHRKGPDWDAIVTVLGLLELDLATPPTGRSVEVWVLFDSLGQPYRISKHPEHKTIGALRPTSEGVCTLIIPGQEVPDDNGK